MTWVAEDNFSYVCDAVHGSACRVILVDAVQHGPWLGGRTLPYSIKTYSKRVQVAVSFHQHQYLGRSGRLAWVLRRSTASVMIPMFEITSDDIAQLNDEDLRSLVGHLCESEVRTRVFSAASVTWGGNQSAADGGIDVRVALQEGIAIDGFVPRPQTGLQVKKPDLGPSEILDEMCPKGVLRPAIRDLADRKGAYIIASAAATSDTALKNRLAAMKEAVQDLPNAADLTLDFYDRGRLASWVREHAGLVPWVRAKIGRSVAGWRPFGAWAYQPDGISGEYLLDNKVRIRTDTELPGAGLQALDGIQRIRELLRQPRKVLRLVGLSGVGKTRLVQALFDERIGTQSLNPALAVYTDIADGPDPGPTELASNLIASRTTAILVIDNCPPDLHRRLSDLCRAPESRVSLVTVEYDIREDQPEGTEVVRLEPSSLELIEKLVKHRYPHISPVDSRTIAEFSGGNARIAIALSETVGRHETIAGMSDDHLFKRLFQQGNEANELLLRAAQALSLVYSFQGEDVSDGAEAELFRLGALINANTDEMFRSVAELKNRGLVQQRGVWRAVLPPAIANRLAAVALRSIPYSTIETWLIDGASERFVKSFTRRLGYLDSSQEAEKIVQRWLGVGGWLEKVADFNDFGATVLDNIAPVAPEAVLSALERAILESNSDNIARKNSRYVPLLRSLAYEADLFERSAALLMKIAEAQDNEREQSGAAKAFASLFTIYFSGTHATLDQRLAVIQRLVQSGDLVKRKLGLMALKAALETSHFGPRVNYEFGARSRDYGYWPSTRESVKQWYSQTLELAEKLACSDEPSATQARKAMADEFRGLWTGAAMYDELERVCCAISEKGFWSEGWLAVRQTIYYDSKGFTDGISAKLASLEALLQPKDLVQKVRSIVLSESVTFVGVDSSDNGTDIKDILARVEAMAYDLGKDVASDKDSFAALLPDLIDGTSQQLWHVGRGLAKGAKEPRDVWNQLVAQLSVSSETGNPQVLRSFLNGVHEAKPELVNELLDDAVENETLAEWYPLLQTAVGVDKQGLQRLMRSLDLGKAQVGIYGHLRIGRVTHQLSGDDFNELLLRIAAKPGGFDIAIEILLMRLSFPEGRKHSSPSQIIYIGCELMRRLTFGEGGETVDNYKLGRIARHCLVREKGAATVREICSNLKEAVSRSETSAFSHRDLLQILLNSQPLAALEALCGGDAEHVKLGIKILDEAGQLQRHPFDEISEADLLTWCDQQPESRYPAAAAGVTAFRPSGETGVPDWTTTARKLLDQAPNRIEVLQAFIDQFSWSGGYGSRTSAVESNMRLLDELLQYPDMAVSEFVQKEKVRLTQAIQAVKLMESPIDRERDERFE
jgi:hypothetical protein